MRPLKRLLVGGFLSDVTCGCAKFNVIMQQMKIQMRVYSLTYIKKIFSRIIQTPS